MKSLCVDWDTEDESRERKSSKNTSFFLTPRLMFFRRIRRVIRFSFHSSSFLGLQSRAAVGVVQVTHTASWPCGM
jgi:hypothetical protein